MSALRSAPERTIDEQDMNMHQSKWGIWHGFIIENWVPNFQGTTGITFLRHEIHKERLDISAQTLSWNFWVFLESLSPWGIIHRCSWSQDRTRRKAGSPWYLSMGARYFCRADLWWSLWKSPKNRCWSVIFHFLVLYIWLYSNIFRFIMTGWWCNVPILKNDGLRQFCQDDIPYGKSSKCLKPPTRWFMMIYARIYISRYKSWRSSGLRDRGPGGHFHKKIYLHCT